LLRPLVRSLGESLVRLYYPEPTVTGAEHLRPSGPAIFVLNHPNGLLDPLVLRVAVGRPVRFLAKGTLFGNPLGRLAMEAFGSIPVHRAQDVRAGDGEAGRAVANEKAFARCRELLATGEAIALFPEGVSHSEPHLRPLKTGAARIALSAERQHRSGLVVIPVGLGYEQKTTFRSRVLLVVGPPLVIAARLDDFQRDERAATESLTCDIRAALDEVVLQAESHELLEGVARVATWTAPEAAQDLAAQHRRSRALLSAYQIMATRAPADVEPIVRAARQYARILRRLGVRDPWALELGPIKPGRALAAIGLLLIAAPVAALGALMGWVPYRLAGRVAARVTRDDDVLGTVKLLGGSLFLLVAWLLEALVAGALGGVGWGLAAFLAGPLTGYVALRFDELWGAMRESLRLLWLRGIHFDQVRRLADRRRALADAVSRALDASRSEERGTAGEIQ